jgi:hypothetical protein
MRRAAKGPAETAASNRPRTITEEAEAAWVRDRQAEADAIKAQRAAAREERAVQPHPRSFRPPRARLIHPREEACPATLHGPARTPGGLAERPAE